MRPSGIFSVLAGKPCRLQQNVECLNTKVGELPFFALRRGHRVQPLWSMRRRCHMDGAVRIMFAYLSDGTPKGVSIDFGFLKLS